MFVIFIHFYRCPVFVINAGSYPSLGFHFKGRLLTSLGNVRLLWQWLTVTNTSAYCNVALIGLYPPLDGITYPKYKLLCFITTIIFVKLKKALAFYWDRSCHLALCLWLILCAFNTFTAWHWQVLSS